MSELLLYMYILVGVSVWEWLGFISDLIMF